MSSDFELTDDTPVYVISVAAQLSGLHPQTLRTYDPSTQRSIFPIDQIAIVPLRDVLQDDRRATLFDYLSRVNASHVIVSERDEVETHAAKCGIPPQVSDQLKNGHKNTEKMEKQVCAVAQQAGQRGPAGPSLSEVLGSSASLPEATPSKKGGSTFDTLNGNVLTR